MKQIYIFSLVLILFGCAGSIPKSEKDQKIILTNINGLNFKFNSPAFYAPSNLEAIQNLNLTGDTLNFIRSSILTKIPSPKSLVNDYFGILNQSEIDSLELLLVKYDDQFGIQIAVVTVYPFMYENIDSFSTNLFNKWGIGHKKTNNGILFVYDFIDKKIKIENGYGIEKIYTDEETRSIIDKVIKPRFREAKYFEGIYYAANQMAEEVLSKEKFIKKK
jgi:uncharacterized membrane protein YgcG